MAALRARNEKIRAVGNLNCNARGDIIDSYDNVIEDGTKRVNDFYMKGVLNRRQQQSTQDQKTQPSTLPAKTVPSIHTEADQIIQPPVLEPDFTPEELEFDQEDEQAVQEIPAKSSKTKK
jgi:hypothetical protein